ncbi:DNA polymerase III subunit delta' [Vibrio sp. SM6]|uniref:DNA polymerase III subunit delta' n=1 Tax=Vibrio agarilyticus TaxID=2726741 RepID=A0A7X8TNZ4_9VIBR|nr:DNA polymerase III subunit delta' [Vibrio agarilyticus]NLS11503.1 DNA polymerase III subunit delta' [Vibrio agarilyticus]
MNEWQSYPWLTPLWHQWQGALTRNVLPNALLLNSAEELGAEALVNQLAQTLLCQHSDIEPCGFCHSCSLFLARNHPDFHSLNPEKSGKSITVDQIRQCNRLAQESSQLGGYRVFIIEPADAMNEAAANALLKTLEEPGLRCYFILMTAHPQRLLPTILSRCQQWYLATPSTQTSLEWLSQRGQHHITAAMLKLNSGSPLRAERFFRDDQWSAYQKVESEFLAVLLNESADEAPLVSAIITETLPRLAWLWHLLCDGQKTHFSLNDATLLPGAQRLAEVPYFRLQRMSQSLVALMQQLRTHSGLNEELLVMNWLIESREDVCL